jgi:hypothetical protein
LVEENGNAGEVEVSGLFVCHDILVDIPSRVNPASTGMDDAAQRQAFSARSNLSAGLLPRRLNDSPFDIAVETDDWHLPDQVHAFMAATEWTGQKWFPGCYSGDSSPHVLTVGLYTDVEAHNRHGDNLERLVQDVMSRTSFIYESQLNIRLEIGTMNIYTTETNAPSYAVGCPDIDTRLTLFQEAHSSQPFDAARHLLSGCGQGWGVVGRAFVGSLCYDGWNHGVTELFNSMSWVTFAHELGHTFGGDHSFEEGKGTTGGIMDYGDGTLNGEYQFNTMYRKSEMCQVMNEAKSSCSGKFRVDESSASTPASTPLPSPPPSSSTCGYSSEACRAAGNKLNLNTDGQWGYSFIGNHGVTGCFAYSEGLWAGTAWYGLKSDGTEVQSESELSDLPAGQGLYRPDGTSDCTSTPASTPAPSPAPTPAPSPAPTPSPASGPSPDCQDLLQSCPYWAESGFCKGEYEVFMAGNCKESCDLCDAVQSCSDEYAECPLWTQAGYCSTGEYVSFMQTYCRSSCSSCGFVVEKLVDEAMVAPKGAPESPPDPDSTDSLVSESWLAAPCTAMMSAAVIGLL